MQNPTPQPAFDTEAEYRTIERALLDSARGRWFLAEHGRRARRLDSALLEDAIGRLQGSLRSPPALLGQLKAEVERIGADLATVRNQLLARQPADPAAHAAHGADAPHPPAASVQEILRAAETLHEKAWLLHGDELDAARCEAIARDAQRIAALGQAQAVESSRARSFAAALERTEHRLAAVLASIIHEMEVDHAGVAQPVQVAAALVPAAHLPGAPAAPVAAPAASAPTAAAENERAVAAAEATADTAPAAGVAEAG